ncbi:transposase [Paenibacillus larvae]|uniref:Uncharacterized protein n=1 Tax=Paenibacillus larvae subsp. larvae TaxID=147375 RepID=A0A6C0QZ83_9BACL|nr:transposase [Paenibacillus larvae]QHZ54022.1 hypothetical protein ERICV_05038 [Paenibacillus larvae subsp. larvae]
MNIEITDALLVAVIIGLVECAKGIGMPARFSPIFSIALGITVGIVYFPGDLKTSIIYGIICGLTSSGLYSAGKNTIQQK